MLVVIGLLSVLYLHFLWLLLLVPLLWSCCRIHNSCHTATSRSLQASLCVGESSRVVQVKVGSELSSKACGHDQANDEMMSIHTIQEIN